MDASVKWVLGLIVGTIKGIAASSDLTKGLGDYNQDLYKFVTAIQSTVVKPVAFAIMALFVMFEIQRISLLQEKIGGGPEGMIRAIGLTVAKYAIISTVLASLPKILSGLISLNTELTNGIKGVVSGKAIDGGVTVASMWEPLKDLGFFSKMFLAIALLLGWLLLLAAVAMVKVMVAVRFLQLYVLFAMAPVPIATLPSAEYSSIAKGFFKTFMATAIQGTLLYMVQIFYPYLLTGVFHGANGLSELMIGVIAMAVLLMIGIMQTDKWAKALTAAM